MPSPITRYRPTKTQDGEGGWTEALAGALVVYGTLQEHDNKIAAIVEANEDIDAGDILDVDGAYYRVVGLHHVPGTLWRKLDLERQTRPINP